MKEKILSFLKKETILSLASLLAVGSCFLVKPDAEYPGYVDLRTLILLFCLMAVMAGFQKLGLFRTVGEGLLGKVCSQRGIAGILIALCFMSSMLITNDVALITFVPFAIFVLKMAEMETHLSLTITLMTIAANLGSMLTPIGNPQNLYLYSVSGISMEEFLLLMLPYSLLAALLLGLAVLFGYPKRAGKSAALPTVRQSSEQTASDSGNRSDTLDCSGLLYYLALFLFCLACVLKLLNVYMLFVLILAGIILKDREILKRVDYSLLLTFVAFFIFIGNMGRIQVFKELLLQVIQGRETLIAVISSQVISNVPTALLLSGFTDQYASLIVGTNLGGLGTLIASMASLISYKQIVRQYPDKKGRYFRTFTIWNLLFLAVLGAAAACL